MVLVWCAPSAFAATMTIGETTLVPNAGNLANFSSQDSPVFQGDASGNYLTSSPVAGTITSWRFLSAGAATGKTFVLRVLRPTDGTGMNWRAVATSNPALVTSGTNVDAVNGPYPANIPIQAGDRIGLAPDDDVYTPIEMGVNGQDGVRFFNGFLADGASAAIAPGSTGDSGQVVPIQATVDFASTSAGGSTTAPQLSGLALTPTAFRAAASGASIAAARRNGTKVTYSDTEAAVTAFIVMRAHSGRRAGKRCVKPGRSAKHGLPCTYYTRLGSFTHTDTAGRNHFQFTGRLRGHKLPPGTYQLLATPQALGKSGQTARAPFRIVP
jgi:hypothetical protein